MQFILRIEIQAFVDFHEMSAKIFHHYLNNFTENLRFLIVPTFSSYSFSYFYELVQWSTYYQWMLEQRDLDNCYPDENYQRAW